MHIFSNENNNILLRLAIRALSHIESGAAIEPLLKLCKTNIALRPDITDALTNISIKNNSKIILPKAER